MHSHAYLHGEIVHKIAKNLGKEFYFIISSGSQVVLLQNPQFMLDIKS